MKSYSTAFATELARDAHSSIARCVQIGTATPVYRTLWNVPVTYGGITYTPDVFDFGEVQAALLPVSPSLTFRIQNLRDPTDDSERPWSIVLNGENINGTTLTMLAVSTALLSDTSANETASFTILKARIAGGYCEMQLGPPNDLSRMRLPWPSIRSRRCTHEYKDGLCKSESAHATCPTKDLTACGARHPAAALRFSQIPYDTDMRDRRG